MPDCSCSPSPPPSNCGSIPTPPAECGRIRMFFGYKTTEASDTIPGSLDKLFYTPSIDSSFIENGFQIQEYSCKILKDSKILENLENFTLSEAELLSSGSFESWVLFGSVYITSSPGQQNITNKPFSVRCMEDIGINMGTFRSEAMKMWTSFNKYGDTVSIYSVLKSIFGGDTAIPKLDNITIKESQYCEAVKLNQRIEKLRICYEWFKNIHDTYYGREFLVKIAGPKPEGQDSVFPGICIKDEQGQNPTFDISISNNKAFYIEGNGSSQGFYTSDEITDGGFPKKDSTDILGLTNINWVQNTDGKIESFVKIGKVSGTNDEVCEELQTKFLYKKFQTYDAGSDTRRCVDWNIDLTKLDISNYYIDNNVLYLKSDIENRFYVDAQGTWVKFTLAEKVPLTAIDTNVMGGIVTFSYLLNLVGGATVGNAKKSIVYYYNYFKNNQKDLVIDGARGNSSQLNLARAEPPCLIPQGVVIPFKSNVYRYGPYYYAGDPNTEEGGGAELVVQENIAPWNFIKGNDTSFPSTYPYCAMDSFGKNLAKFAPKGLQKLEKGRVTAAGLPCHKLGVSVDEGYDNNKGSGPTLLTDINVEYGGGGFTTTYNFSTYTPRLGKTEKYLLDDWQDSIKNSQYINSYLRNEKVKVQNIKKDYTKKLIEKNYFFTPSTKHKGSTPNRLVFSGYYFIPEDNLSQLPNPVTYEPVVSSFPDVSECDPSANPNYSIDGSPEPVYSAEPYRRYTFAESAEGYSIEYLQNTYFQLAGMSMDGFYLPVSLRGVGNNPNNLPEFSIQTSNNTFTRHPSWDNKARLPRFAMKCNFSGSFIEWDTQTQYVDDFKNYNKPGYPIATKTRDEIPPFKLKTSSTESSDCYLLPINQRYLNPYTTKAMLSAENTSANFEPWDSRKNQTVLGFVMSSIVFGDTHAEYQISHTNIYDTGGDGLELKNADEHIRQQINNFRIPALRGPLVLQGWGYDTTGKPIPNSSDAQINTELGQFRKDRLTNKFQKDWLQNPRSWPVGPIDLRFDRERGVWTCPSPNKIIVARLKEDLSPNGTAKAELLNPKADDIKFYEKYHISGPNGENIKLNMDQTEIQVYDFLGESIKSCSKVYVYYDDNRYIVLRAIAESTDKPIIRFKLIEFCDINTGSLGQTPNYGDDWTSYAGYMDKFPNSHILGIRINCDGEIVDKDGNLLTKNDLFDPILGQETIINNDIDKAKKIFVNILDTVGIHGPARSTYLYDSTINNTINNENFEQWFNDAATGFGAISDIPPSGSCSLGINSDQCVTTNDQFKTYEILFLDTYARFVECVLKQDLYVTDDEVSSKYSEDNYKIENPSGNASAEILEYYGDSPNGRLPKFFTEDGEQIEFRVFDPFKDVPANQNPFFNLKENDKVLTIFNENLKKYIIWQSINNKKEKEDKVIKFALVSDKNTTDIMASGVLVDQWGRPIDDKGLLLDDNNFANNFIMIRDPFVSRTTFAPAPNNGSLTPNLTAFGPALGSNILDEHYNGIQLSSLGDGSHFEYMPPFLGFALKRSLKDDTGNEIETYEMLCLEHYAKYVIGKICTKTDSFAYDGEGRYLATLKGHKEGIIPIGRNIDDLPRGNLIINHTLQPLYGAHSAIGGDLIDGANDSSYDNIDGCKFIAVLDSESSTTDNLIYTIVESERFALVGEIKLKQQIKANTLNDNEFVMDINSSEMESQWGQGFMWDQIKSPTNFKKVKLINRPDYVDRGLFITNSILGVNLYEISVGGDPKYSVNDGGTIARTVQRYISNSAPGLYGLPNGIPIDDRKVDNNDDFIHGLDPSLIDDDLEKPIIDMSDDQQWMTYDQSIITAVWDETLSGTGTVKNCKYKIIYAQEAPVIITGQAYIDILPEEPETLVQIDPLPIGTGLSYYSSCQGVDREPVDILLTKVTNPMGYGAKTGDLVTIQRVFNGAVKFGVANYYYIIIGTGHPPGPLKG